MTMRNTLLCATLIGATCATATAQAEEVNVYSYRQEFLIRPLLDAFTEETGIKVNVVFAKSGLLERIEHEGRNTPADLFLTAGIGPLQDAVDRDLVAPIKSDIIEQNVPEHFRDPDGKWIGLTGRARIIYASKERVQPGEISTYEELADPKWKGRVCTRSGKHNYNLSLIGSMIAHHGEAETEQWLAGLKANLARRPQGADRNQVKAIMEGICDVALGNSYYYGKMVTNDREPEQKEWAASAYLIFPNQEDRGTHMNISGASLIKYAPHPEAAVKLVEWLTEEKAQEIYASVNFEFPVKPNTPWSDLLKENMSDFKADEINLGEVAKYRDEAAKMVDRVGFDN